MSLMRTKPIEQSIAETDEPDHRLKKDLTALDLTVFGIGVVVGAGLFVLTGEAANAYAGPAIALSFVIAGVACALAALCYAEFASTVPVAGSAYTFGYATLGEFVAWIIGWDLILELLIGAAAVAAGWSSYLGAVLEGTPLEIPPELASATDGTMNLPAGLLVLALTLILVIGIKLSSRVNQIAVAIKVGVAVLFVIVGVFFIKAGNLTPFIPPAQGSAGAQGSAQPVLEWLFGLESQVYGFGGMLTAAAIVFFAYIGFDIVATTAEEARNPQRDLPLGILGSLTICTALYIAVSLVLTGMQDYRRINIEAPLSEAVAVVTGYDWLSRLIAIGAAVGIIVVIMILLLGQTRVAFAMARDGLLPSPFAKVHPRFGTPWVVTTTVGVFVALVATFFGIEELADLVSIGALFAFIVVSVGVLVLRRTRPDLERGFRTPFVPLIPIASVVVCSLLMLYLTLETWYRFLIWMAIGFVVYFGYGRRNSRLGKAAAEQSSGQRR